MEFLPKKNKQTKNAVIIKSLKEKVRFSGYLIIMSGLHVRNIEVHSAITHKAKAKYQNDHLGVGSCRFQYRLFDWMVRNRH